jgi:hypothetical protein
MSIGETDNEEHTAADTSDTPGPSSPPISVGRADRFQVVVHVEAEELKACSESCSAEIGEEGLHVSAETSRRLACDASVVRMVHGANGEVLDVGRKTRTVPTAIRRALDFRDKGCRFPGCGLRYTDAHHIVHWADGGETKLDNLTLLCGRHHRLVHEEGFRVEMVEGSIEEGRATAPQRERESQWGCGVPPQIRFSRPDGTTIPDVPVAVEVPTDPATAMKRENAEGGVDPDAWTATSRWNGEVLDLALALDGLLPLTEGDR